MQVPGLVAMELVSADAAGDRGGTGVGIEDPLYQRLLCVINARRTATTADWPSGAQTLAVHPLQVSPDRLFPNKLCGLCCVCAYTLCLLGSLSEHFRGAGAISMG